MSVCLSSTQRQTNRFFLSTMISSIAWVPKGVAASTPVRHELSSVERELINWMQQQELTGPKEEEEENDNSESVAAERRKSNHKVDHANDTHSPDHHEHEKPSSANVIQLPTFSPEAAALLPAELRMDEYSDDAATSDDDDDDDNMNNDKVIRQQMVLGNLLMERDEISSGDDSNIIDHLSVDENEDIKEDDESDHDMQNIPDSREFDPVDVAGLQAMGLSDVSCGKGFKDIISHMDDDKDDSEAEDIRINPDDAVIVVAKTEDVSTGTH
jgi:hypothetical protein